MPVVISRRDFALLLAAIPLRAGESMTAEERKSLLEQLEASARKFEASIADVAPEQWNRKPGPERWSVAEVAEHIGLSEVFILAVVRDKIMKSPERPPAPQAREMDAKIRPILLDRSGKAQAPEMLKPASRWPDKGALVKEFRENRGKTIEYASTTTEALRAHSAPHPTLKMLDAYQWLLMLSAHTERHTLQIEEVKAALKA